MNSPSAASDLPVELLLAIFTFCKPDSIRRRLDWPDVTPTRMPDEKEFPALYVNKRWRAAALNYHPIPIYLDLYLPSGSDAAVRARTNTLILSRLRSYLHQLSPSAPLSFHIRHWTNNSGTPEPLPVEILKLLCAYSDHWSAVSIQLLPITFDAIHHSMQGPYPQLKSLVVEDTESFPSIFGGRVIIMPSFAHAPNLTSLSIFFRGMFHPDISIPWHQLTNLTIRFPYQSTFHAMLSQCPNLRECTVKDSNMSTINWTRPAAPLYHPALRVLRLKGSAKLSAFLPLIHAPNVEEIYSDCAIFGMADVDALATLPSLRTAHLFFAFFSERTASQFLPRLPPSLDLDLELLCDMPGCAFAIFAQSDPRHSSLSLKFKKTKDEEGLVDLARACGGERLHVEAALSHATIETLRALGTGISGLGRCEELAETADRETWGLGKRLYRSIVRT